MESIETFVKTRICVTGEHISLLETASKLVGFLRWSGEKYKTSNDIRAHPACIKVLVSPLQGSRSHSHHLLSGAGEQCMSLVRRDAAQVQLCQLKQQMHTRPAESVLQGAVAAAAKYCCVS